MSDVKMFNKNSFNVFKIEGLEPRMTAIKADIQPIFQSLGEQFLSLLTERYPKEDFYLHIAQHIRRTANAPENTWSAISTQKRGYKMEVHFQLGIWENYVFLYLSMIDQPKDKLLYAEKLQGVKLPEDFVVSNDHTKPEFFDASEFSKVLTRFSKVKKAELEFGRIWSTQDFEENTNEKMINEMVDTLTQLLPFYEKLMR